MNNTLLDVKNLTMKFGGLTAIDDLSFSANNDPRGIEAWIKKHRLREKRFLQLAIPKK